MDICHKLTGIMSVALFPTGDSCVALEQSVQSSKARLVPEESFSFHCASHLQLSVCEVSLGNLAAK